MNFGRLTVEKICDSICECLITTDKNILIKLHEALRQFVNNEFTANQALKFSQIYDEKKTFSTSEVLHVFTKLNNNTKIKKYVKAYLESQNIVEDHLFYVAQCIRDYYLETRPTLKWITSF